MQVNSLIEILQKCKLVLHWSTWKCCGIPVLPFALYGLFSHVTQEGVSLKPACLWPRTKPVQCTRLCRWPTAENCNGWPGRKEFQIKFRRVRCWWHAGDTPCNTCNTWRLRWGGAFKVSGRVALLDSRWTETVNTHAAFNGRPRFYIYTYIHVSVCVLLY